MYGVRTYIHTWRKQSGNRPLTVMIASACCRCRRRLAFGSAPTGCMQQAQLFEHCKYIKQDRASRPSVREHGDYLLHVSLNFHNERYLRAITIFQPSKAREKQPPDRWMCVAFSAVRPRRQIRQLGMQQLSVFVLVASWACIFLFS